MGSLSNLLCPCSHTSLNYLSCFFPAYPIIFIIFYSLCSQESLAFMFEMAHLHEDSLREYDELELCYLETGA